MAKPFVTTSNYLEENLELRVAPELYLKKLIIGGFEKVYEVGKVFRNEGISNLHNPEFTSCEFYMAYKNYEDLIMMTEEFFKDLSMEFFGTTKVTIPSIEKHAYTAKERKKLNIKEKEDLEIEFQGPFKRYYVIPEIESYFNTNIDLTSENLQKNLQDLIMQDAHLSRITPDIQNLSIKQLFESLIENIIEPKCIQPSYILDHPSILSPLAKSKEDNPLLCERFELFISGIELINAYSELNNAATQKDRFDQQKNMKELSSQKFIDEDIHGENDDFVEALTYGMPPTAGWGLGIDRLVMMLTGSTSVKEAILFPMFRSSVIKTQKKANS